MRKLFLPVTACLLLAGCGSNNQFMAHLKGYTLVCVAETGVMYAQFPTGVAPLYRDNGTLVTCK